MRLRINTKVKIVGNNSQGIQHFAKLNSCGYVVGYRNGMILKGNVTAVDAYIVLVDNSRWVVAAEDLEVD